MRYPAGLFVRVLYSLSLLGLVIAIGLTGSSWAGMVLGGSILNGIRPLLLLCFVLFRVVQVFRNPEAMTIHAPNPALRFFRGAALLLMFANLLLVGAVTFMGPLTKWLFNGQTGDAGIAYFAVTLVLILGLFLTSSGVILYEVVRLAGDAHKRDDADEEQAAVQTGKGKFGMKSKTVLIVLALMWASSYFVPYHVRAALPFSNLMGSSAPPRFEEVCSQTGTFVLSAPQQEVRSVYLAHGPSTSDNRFQYPIHDGNRIGPTYWGSSFFPELAVDSPYADVVVSYDADDKEAAGGPFVHRKLVRYTATATDRRNNTVLGKMSYAIDISRGYGCGANTPEGIDVNAFLRKVTAMSGAQAEAAPVPKVTAELVDSEIFSPPKSMDAGQWSDEVQPQAMAARCDAALPHIGDAMRRFADTSHGLRVMHRELTDHLVCLDSAIFRVQNIGERNHTPIQVDKYATDGRHLYSLQVFTPDASGPDGFVVEKNFGAEDGYLHFEKWKAESAAGVWQLGKISRFRVAEPKELELADANLSKEVPEWATFFHEENLELEQDFPTDANSLVPIRDLEERVKDASREAQCDRIAPKDPRQFGIRRFTADASGRAGMEKLGIADICDDSGVWSIGRRPDRGGMAFVVQKYSPAGVIQYKLKFLTDTPNGDDTSSVYLAAPSLHSQDGYLQVELWFYRPARQQDGQGFMGDKYLVLRHIAGRVKEPPL